MDTVNFQCGHCGKLMGVLPALLGQQVRCPHCQQIVVAPATAPPPAAPPPADSWRNLPAPTDEDSIFSPPEQGDDDLFGSGPKPQVEMPPGLAWAAPPPAPPAAEPPPLPPAVLDLTLPPPEPTLTYVPPAEGTVPDAGAGLPPVGPFGNGSPAPAPAPAETAGEMAPEVVAEARRSAAPRPRGGSGWWVYPLLIIPLVSYSIFATIALAMAWLQLQNKPPDPFYLLPDPGEAPATRRKMDFGRMPLLPLPPELRVPLKEGASIQVGDLRVTPKKVVLGKVDFPTQGFAQTQPSRFPTLALYLEFENVSEDVYFRPLDRYFNRLWDKEQFQTNMPFTYLEMGDSRLFGGPNKWEPAGKNKDAVETVEGQNYDHELKPGEKWTSFVCIDPETQDPEKLAKHPEDDIARYQGALTYRVHVRRGLVKHRGRDVSTTAVIGVDFTSQDVQKTG